MYQKQFSYGEEIIKYTYFNRQWTQKDMLRILWQSVKQNESCHKYGILKHNNIKKISMHERKSLKLEMKVVAVRLL